MTRSAAAHAGILLWFSQVVVGQQAAVPTFEVASVKPNKTSEAGRQGALFRENINTSQGRVTLRNVTLQSCIKCSYGLQDTQIAGPDWLTVERYDIVAKASGPTPEEQLKRMLQALLAERFKLSVHRETKELSVMAMTVGKNGPKLR